MSALNKVCDLPSTIPSTLKITFVSGTDNQGTYFVLTPAVTHAWTVGTWQHLSMTIQTNGNGTVTLKVYDNDTNTLITQGTDSGGTNPNWTCPDSYG